MLCVCGDDSEDHFAETGYCLRAGKRAGDCHCPVFRPLVVHSEGGVGEMTCWTCGKVFKVEDMIGHPVKSVTIYRCKACNSREEHPREEQDSEQEGSDS